MQATVQKRDPAICRRWSSTGFRRLVLLLLAVLSSLARTQVVSAQASANSEYQVKAAFLFHFAQFVDWPPETFKGANSPVTYCTIGEDPLHGALDQSLSGKMIGARPLRVQHFKQPQQMQDCQILFIGAVDKKRMSTALASVRGNPVLTVSDSEHFAQEGGMIGFCLEENKIRFEINLDAAGEAKLKISAKLLALARKVFGNPRGN